MTTTMILRNGDPEETKFGWLAAAIVFVCLECLVGLQAFLAYRDHFFTAAQMKERGIDQGLPFNWHFGMWGDFLVISGLAAYVVGRHFSRWRLLFILISLAIGFVSAGLLSWLYTVSNIPEAHIQSHRLTATGWVHLFYMAIAVAVFIQFLFFSENVSILSLRLISLLLLAHVFFGTHMALGFLKLAIPLDWYPTQPLRSLFGWMTICAVGFGLAWRNFGLRRALLQRRRTTEEYLRFLNYVCKNVSWPYFVGRFGAALIWGETSLVLVLVVVVGAIYEFSRRSVREEFEIGTRIFPSDPDRIPDRLKFDDRTKITLTVALFMALYLALGWVAHCILVASLCMFVIACIDLNTRRLINKNVREDFENPRYAPHPSEPGYTAMMDRRTIVSWYLLELPHLSKETARIVGCAAAVAIANYSYFTSTRDGTPCVYIADALYCAAYGNPPRLNQLDSIAYIVLLGTLILNELVTWWWRRDRDNRLRRI